MPSDIPRNYFRGQIYKFFSFFFVFYCFLFYLKIKDTEKLSSQRLFNIKKLRKYVKEGVKVSKSKCQTQFKVYINYVVLHFDFDTIEIGRDVDKL